MELPWWNFVAVVNMIADDTMASNSQSMTIHVDRQTHWHLVCCCWCHWSCAARIAVFATNTNAPSSEEKTMVLRTKNLPSGFAAANK